MNKYFDHMRQNKDGASKEFVGKPIEHAEANAKLVRVIIEDGREFFVTDDLRADRLNVITEKGIVTDAWWG